MGGLAPNPQSKMQWPCLLSLPSLFYLIVPTVAGPQQLRAKSSLLGLSKHRAKGEGQSWDYNDGGASWKDGSCAGTDYSQSPVNISTTVAAIAPDDDTFFFKYPSYESPVKMINDGRFLYATFDNDENGRIGNLALGTSYPNHLTEQYNLYKMVIHTPSEHTYNGVKLPLEIQLFHHKKYSELTDGEAAPGDTAIVAVGFGESRDEASPFLKSLIDGGLPDQRGGTSLVNRAYPSVLEFSDLFKPVFGAQGVEAPFWDYTGSLTQPPCSGGVRWFVRQEAMNAKKTTLKYFTDVVKRSSDGVPGNARKLQIIGTRPVFPRFPQNAVHMMAYQPEEPAAFKEAFARVKAHQAEFKKALKTDAGGADAAMAAGNDPLLASNQYKDCLDALGAVASDLELAETKETDECNKALGFQKSVDSIAGGPARIEASAKYGAAKKSCEDVGKVVQAKTGQKAELDAQCNTIKSKVEKEAEAAALKKAEADAKKK